MPSFLSKALQDELSSKNKPLQSSVTLETDYLRGQFIISEDLILQPHFMGICDLIIGHGVTNNNFIQYIFI